MLGVILIIFAIFLLVAILKTIEYKEKKKLFIEERKKEEAEKQKEKGVTSMDNHIPGEAAKKFEKRLREDAIVSTAKMLETAAEAAETQGDFSTAARLYKVANATLKTLLKLEMDGLTEEEWNTFAEFAEGLGKE